MAEPTAAAWQKGAWRRFDPGRRQRILDALHGLLRTHRRPFSEADAIAGHLERWGAFYKRDPKQRQSDADLLATFPWEVSNRARALRDSIRKHDPTLATFDKHWQNVFDRESWAAFRSVLAFLAKQARQNRRPRDQRLRSLERKVLEVFEQANLLTITNRNIADILAEIKAHSLGTPIPREPDTRIKALRDAVKRRSLNP
jgi:hypothetical protein